TLTQPYIPLIIIVAVLLFSTGLAYTQAERLTEFFFAQAAINGAILTVAVLSAALIIWEVFSLSRAIVWVAGTRTSGSAPSSTQESSADMPQLLYPLQSLMDGKTVKSGFSTENLSIVMDAIKARNDERRDLSQYLLQLLIFLGLFGTFWGLTLTVGNIGNAIGQMNQESASRDAGELFEQMIRSLEDPIGSMGIAFSSSLFGLAGTIIIGFLEQQSAQAHGRFIDELENWLYQHAILSSAGTGGGPYPMAVAGAVAASTTSFNEEVLTATNAKLEQIDVGLARNHDTLFATVEALVAIQENQRALLREENGKISNLNMLIDTNQRMSEIMDSWNRRSDQYFDDASRGQAQMVKVAEDIERLLKARDTTRTLNDRLAELSRELGENARRTENAFTNLRDFLSGNETGNQLQALLDSMESNRAELQAFREEAASRGTPEE
ncbi:MAG: hypothetical protein P8R39_01670, partial [Alphaproteobacteria bacterium]|nr:hypothetical protein [Alphaproteobacteria bacterium]